MFFDCIFIVALHFAVSTVAAQGINIKDSKVLKVLWNKKELNVSNNASAIILENRVYVPAYLFRQANLTVQLNNNILSLSESKTKYIKNLDILNGFRRGYMDYFEELDQETMNLLGHIILAEKVDTTVVLGLLDALSDNAKHTGTDSLSIIIDRPDGFSQTISCSESYRNALDNLLKYQVSGKQSDLKAFYSKEKNQSNHIIL